MDRPHEEDKTMTEATTKGMRVRTAVEVEIDDLHDVLLDFELACPLPTTEDVRTWQGRHPAYAGAILDHAAEVAEFVLAGSSLVEPRFDARDEPFVSCAIETASKLRRAARPTLAAA